MENVPDMFCSYCQSALSTEHHQEHTSIIYQGSKAAVIELKIDELIQASGLKQHRTNLASF